MTVKVTPVVAIVQGDGDSPPSLREINKDRAAHNALTRSRVVVAFNRDGSDHSVVKDNLGAFTRSITIKGALGL